MNYFTRLYRLLLVGAFFVTACSETQTQQNTKIPLVAEQAVTRTTAPPTQRTASIITSTPKPIETEEPTVTPTFVRSPTPTLPTPTSLAQATLTALSAQCEPPAFGYEEEISPDSNWIVLACEGVEGQIDSHLRVFSSNGKTHWSIHFADYDHGLGYDRRNLVFPFHWSHDGRYLYAASQSKSSGCCWLGHYMLLVRLNLENGQQTEVVNYDHTMVPAVDFSFSPSDRYFLYIPQDGRDNLFILDLLTWQTRVIKLKFENMGASYTLMSNDDRKVILTLRDCLPDCQNDSTTNSIIVIDLESGVQQKLLSGIDFYDSPEPVSWMADDLVLLQNGKNTGY